MQWYVALNRNEEVLLTTNKNLVDRHLKKKQFKKTTPGQVVSNFIGQVVSEFSDENCE